MRFVRRVDRYALAGQGQQDCTVFQCHGLDGAHEFLVLTLRVVDQGHRGLGHWGQISDLARVVHAQLHHRHAVVRTQIEQGQGHANVVVQVALR